MADPGRRIHRKLDDFPPDVKAAVDEMLADPQATYTEIAEHVTALGYEISRTSIYRYAATVGVDRTRLQKITEQTRRLVQSLQDNHDVEATEVANALLTDALTRRIATAEEEFDDLPLDKAGHLLVQLQRSAVYKTRAMEDKRRLVSRLRESLMAKLRQEVQGDDALMARLGELVEQSGQEVLSSEA